MASLQIYAMSFNRQGFSGLVWDDKFLKIEIKRKEEEDAQAQAPAQA